MRLQNLDEEGCELFHKRRFRFGICLQRRNNELGEGHFC